MLRKSQCHPLGIAVLLMLFLCTTVAAAPPPKKQKTPKWSVKSGCPLPQPRFSLLDSCRLEQQFLAPPSSATAEGAPAQERDRSGIVPFVGKDPNLASPPLPERPAIAVADPMLTPSEQVVAGFTYSQNDRLFFNFGYSLPTAPLQEYAQPFGFTLTDEADVKRISIGIDIAF